MTLSSQPGNLCTQLREMEQQCPDWYRTLLSEIAAHLRVTALDGALKVGDVMPPFVLPGSDGALISSDELLASGPLVMYFVRGGWCPFCNATLSAVDAVSSALTSVGGHLVALTPDAGGHAATAKRRLGLRFDLLTDIDCAVALRFGVVYRVPDSYRDALMRFGINLVDHHGDGPGLLPMPSTFVVGTDGTLRFAYVSGNITERAEPVNLVSLVAELSRTLVPDRPLRERVP